MLAFASTVILGPEFYGTQEHILLSHDSVSLPACLPFSYMPEHYPADPEEKFVDPLGYAPPTLPK
jgi:hypothetical protein